MSGFVIPLIEPPEFVGINDKYCDELFRRTTNIPFEFGVAVIANPVKPMFVRLKTVVVLFGSMLKLPVPFWVDGADRIVGCCGPDGPDGPEKPLFGPDGPTGPDGPDGPGMCCWSIYCIPVPADGIPVDDIDT